MCFGYTRSKCKESQKIKPFGKVVWLSTAQILPVNLYFGINSDSSD